MPLPSFGNLSAVGTEKWNVTVRQDKNFKVVNKNMFKNFKRI